MTVRCRARWGHKHGGKHEVFYWVCTFANNQHNAAQELEAGNENIAKNPFAVAITYIANTRSNHPTEDFHVVSIQDDNQGGPLGSVRENNLFTLGRGWCVFEMEWSLREVFPFVPPFAFCCFVPLRDAVTQGTNRTWHWRACPCFLVTGT